MPPRRYLIRQAASLLRFAKETRNPDVATLLVAKAADFNERLDELTLPKMDKSPQAPDVEPET